MGWYTPAVLSLLLLTAGAAPPGDCQPGLNSGPMLPAPLDLTGRPAAPFGLSAQTVSTVPSADAAGACRSALPSAAQATTLRSETDDIIHGLPSPEILRPMNEPKRAPIFQ